MTKRKHSTLSKTMHLSSTKPIQSSKHQRLMKRRLRVLLIQNLTMMGWSTMASPRLMMMQKKKVLRLEMRWTLSVLPASAVF